MMYTPNKQEIDQALERTRRRWLNSVTINAGGRWAILPALLVACTGMALGVLADVGLQWLVLMVVVGVAWIVAALLLTRAMYARAGVPGTPDWALSLDRALGLQDALPAYLESNGRFRDALESRVAAALDRDKEKAAVQRRHWGPLFVAGVLALFPLLFWAPGAAGEEPPSEVSSYSGHTEEQGGPLEISAPQAGLLPDAVIRQPYEQQFEASGGTRPNGWQVHKGMLPPGMAIDFSSGRLSGVPTELGPFSFTLKLLDHDGSQTTQEYSIEVVPPEDGGGEGDGGGNGSGEGNSDNEGEGQNQPRAKDEEGGAGHPPPDINATPEPENTPPDQGSPGDNSGQPPPPPLPEEPPEIESDTGRVKPRVDDKGETYKKDQSRWVYNPKGETRDDAVPRARDINHPGEKAVPRTKVTTRERKLIEEIYRKLWE
jgi:hypothetical protein